MGKRLVYGCGVLQERNRRRLEVEEGYASQKAEGDKRILRNSADASQNCPSSMTQNHFTQEIEFAFIIFRWSCFCFQKAAFLERQTCQL
jgi:hypothetical protein